MTAKSKPQLRLPKKINLLGDTWQIKIVKQPKSDTGENCLGTCDIRTHTITMKPGFQINELTHELSHALLFTQFAQNDEFNANILGKFIEQVMRQIYFI